MTRRVIQWSTGHVGMHALRALVRHPDLELVGLWVHSADKARRDAGDLCGLPPTGVVATSDDGGYCLYLTEERGSRRGPQQRRRREKVTQ